MIIELAKMLPDTTFAGEASRMALVLVFFVAVFLLAEMWHVFLNPPVEWTRKFVHICCGIVIASFHWIFISNWPVILISVCTAGLIGVSRTMNWFRSIYGVQRKSYGDLYYLLAVIVLFLISHEHSVFYFISILTLTISDALAAILGTTYQRMTYTVETHYKSLEGSVVFFLSTFLIVHIPLLTLTNIDRLHCILIGIQVALLVTYLEAICLNGIDNILVPLGTYYLLLTFTALNSEAIIILLSCQFAILIVCNLIAWKLPFLTMSGTMTVQLFLFAALILGGPEWLIAPLIALIIFILAFSFFCQHRQEGGLKVYQVVAVFYVTLIPGLIILVNDIVNNYVHEPTFLKSNVEFYGLYVGAMTGQLTMSLFRIFWLYSGRQDQGLGSIFLLSICSMALIIPLSLWGKPGIFHVRSLYYTLAVALLSPIFYYYLRHKCESDKFPWEFRIQAISSALAVLVSQAVPTW